jgi:AraC-like DNA-binding protein
MTAHRYVPRPPLSDLVDLFWAYDAYGEGRARERVLPSGTCELVIDLSEANGAPIVCGAHSEAFVIDVATRPALLGVHFKPGGAYPFLGMPASELHNTRVAGDAVWGRLAYELRERVLEAPTPAARFRVLERCLLDRLAAAARRHPAVAYAVRAITDAPARPIVAVTSRIGLSARRFIELFADEVGLTPKLYSRVRRFHGVLGGIWGVADVDWADVAARHGYYDQAHLIHDFRAFTGLTPGAYLRAPRPEPGHVALPD